MISIALEWFKTAKPISGWDGMGWDGLDGWMDGIRVVVGIEHLTVLINASQNITLQHIREQYSGGRGDW